jgi:hypothetical protein
MNSCLPEVPVVQGTVARAGLGNTTEAVDGSPWSAGFPEPKRIQHMVILLCQDTDRSWFCQRTDSHGTGQPGTGKTNGEEHANAAADCA